MHMALPYDPNFRMTFTVGEPVIDRDLEHDASASAAIVAVELISTARLAVKLDSVNTEYSAQYLVDNARPKKRGKVLTVKDCLEFAMKEGLQKVEDWPHLASVSKPKPALVSMKGELIEPKNAKEALDLLEDQPVGAKLHVFSPQIDLVGEGVYCGSSGEAAGYVGLRDVIIVDEQKLQGKSVATVKLWYKNKFQFVKVAMSRMFADYARGIEPTILLVDFCLPRFSAN